MSDQPVLRSSRIELPVSLDLAKAVLDDCLSRAADGLGLWTVHEADSSTPLGCAGLNPTTVAAQYEPALSGLLEPIAAIDPQHWHKGYAHEALRALLDYAFDTLGQTVLAAVNDVPNVASEKMLLRLGFVLLSEVPGPRYRLRTYRLDRKG